VRFWQDSNLVKPSDHWDAFLTEEPDSLPFPLAQGLETRGHPSALGLSVGSSA